MLIFKGAIFWRVHLYNTLNVSENFDDFLTKFTLM